MARRMSRRVRLAGVLSVGSGLLLGAAPAHADDYTDLLSLLRAKGSLTQGEYAGLLSKHVANSGGNSARGTEARRGGRSTEARRGRGTGGGTGSMATDDAVAQAQAAAAAASASAAAAQEAAQSAKVELASPSLVRTSPYVPGKGVDIRVGNIDLNFSGFVNGFYTFSSAAHSANTVAGGLADNSGFDSSSIRNGLLPAGLIFKASTTQNGIDLAAEFGVYPGINSSNQGTPFNANGGGSPVGLGTAGVDFRQVFVTAGTKEFGTVKVGRDIGIFGSDAILSDATLLSVGATGGNSAPANTSLGRIGIGYIYADFMPQITYSSPIMAGFQATVGAFQPLDEVNFAGGGLSATSAAHDTPMFQGKLTYDYKAGATAVRVWLGGLIQPQQGFAAATAVSLNQTSAHAIGDKTTGAGEIGAKIDSGPFGGVVYILPRARRGHDRADVRRGERRRRAARLRGVLRAGQLQARAEAQAGRQLRREQPVPGDGRGRSAAGAAQRGYHRRGLLQPDRLDDAGGRVRPRAGAQQRRRRHRPERVHRRHDPVLLTRARLRAGSDRSGRQG